MPTSPPDAETIRRAVEQVLSQGDYELAPTPVRGELGADWWNWLRERLLDPLIAWWEGLQGRFAWADEFLGGLVLVGLIAVIVAIVRARVRRASAGATPIQATAVDHPAELYRQALQQAEQGAHVTAVRLLLRSIKLRLEELEHRSNRPGVTNRELLRRYRRTPLATPLGRLVDTVDQSWFGNRGCSPEEYRNCLTAYEELTRAASNARRFGT